MNIGGSDSLSLSQFNKYAGASLGLAVGAISLASINHQTQMIDGLYSFSHQTHAAVSSIAKGVIEAWSQNPVAAIGVAAGGFAALQVFSKSSDIAKNLSISVLASTCLIALAKSPVRSMDMAVCLMPLAVLASTYKSYTYHNESYTYHNELLTDAEKGNEEAIKKLLKSFDFLYNQASKTTKDRAGKAFLDFAKKLYAKGDQTSKDEALMILANCFCGGFHVTQSKNAAMLCIQRINSKQAQELTLAYNTSSWHGPVKSDPVVERLIDLYLGVYEAADR